MALYTCTYYYDPRLHRNRWIVELVSEPSVDSENFWLRIHICPLLAAGTGDGAIQSFLKESKVSPGWEQLRLVGCFKSQQFQELFVKTALNHIPKSEYLGYKNGSSKMFFHDCSLKLTPPEKGKNRWIGVKKFCLDGFWIFFWFIQTAYIKKRKFQRRACTHLTL